MTALYRENFRNPNRPITVLMFLGPTGVGKSETAKVLSRLLHDDDDALLAINCSEISEDHRVSALLGATPEYVGREQAPMLDRKKIEKPKSVVLFDEIEKGAPALHNLLLQICDEGEVTLLKDGKKVSFRNSIVIITSNIGQAEMQKQLSTNKLGFRTDHLASASDKEVEDAAIKALLGNKILRPELINRIDEKIVFKPLTDDQLEQVLEQYINKSNKKYHEQNMHLTISPELRRELVASCSDGGDDRKLFGARPIISKYKRLIEGQVARLIATGGIPRGSHVHAVVTEEDEAAPVLKERVKVYHKPSGAFVRKSETGSGAGDNGKRKETANLPAVINSNRALGVAAVAGLAALFISDYLSSSRRIRHA